MANSTSSAQMSEAFRKDYLKQILNLSESNENLVLLSIATVVTAADKSNDIHRQFVKKFREKFPEIPSVCNNRRPCFIRSCSGQQLQQQNNQQSLILHFSDISVSIPLGHTEVVHSILHVIFSDAVTSCQQETQPTEVPCFVEFFQERDLSDQKNLGAMLGEYLALIRICFFLDLSHEKDAFKNHQADFEVTRNHADSETEVIEFSVKSVNFCGAKFWGLADSSVCKEGHPHPQMHPLEVQEPEVCGLHEMETVSCDGDSTVHQSHESSRRRTSRKNILLHDCDCDECRDSPVQRLDIRVVDKKLKVRRRDKKRERRQKRKEETRQEKSSPNLKTRCRAKQILQDLLVKDDVSQSEKKGVVFLASAKSFFELRHSLYTVMERGEKEAARQGDGFCEVRKFIVKELTRAESVSTGRQLLRRL